MAMMRTEFSQRAREALSGTACLVLGGGGFIGTHLCIGLARLGARVHGFGRRPAYPEVSGISAYETERAG